MRLLKSILDFYIRSSLHVSVCFVALAIVYNESYRFYVPLIYYVFLFCSALAGYNLIKYGLIWVKKPIQTTWVIKAMTIVATGIALACTLDFSLYAWSFLIITILINCVYVLPIWKGKGLRYSPFFKLFSVSMVWAILIIAIPQFLHYDAFSTPLIMSEFSLSFESIALIEIHTLKIFILVLALCIPFEIRDLKYDEESLHTLPQVLGVKLSKRIGLLLCAFYLAGIFYDLNLVEQFNIIESVMVLIIGLFIWFSDKFKTDYYASFFVEAIPVLWLVLYIALE
jgi:hypothetical protein